MFNYMLEIAAADGQGEKIAFICASPERVRVGTTDLTEESFRVVRDELVAVWAPDILGDLERSVRPLVDQGYLLTISLPEELQVADTPDLVTFYYVLTSDNGLETDKLGPLKAHAFEIDRGASWQLKALGVETIRSVFGKTELDKAMEIARTLQARYDEEGDYTVTLVVEDEPRSTS